MDGNFENFSTWWQFALFFYCVIFSVLLFPAIVSGVVCFRTARRAMHKALGLMTVFLLPAAGFGLFILVDRFEARGLGWLWWLSMIALHALPIFACQTTIFKNRRQFVKKA